MLRPSFLFMPTAFLALALLGGCDQDDLKPSSTVTTRPSAAARTFTVPFATADEAYEWLNNAIATGEANFLSHGGQWIGSDIDQEITFLANGRVRKRNYGVAIFDFDGAYTIGGDGQILLSLPDDAGGDLALRLAINGSDAYLFPDDGTTSGHVVDRGNDWQKSGMNPFWPFKHVPAE